jgi:phage-related protein
MTVKADKALVLLSGEITTPPVSRECRREIGFLIRMLQMGLNIEMPHSRPMPSIGHRCHELRVNDAGRAWRIIYRTDPDTILILGVFEKKTRTTPEPLIKHARRLLRHYDAT